MNDITFAQWLFTGHEYVLSFGGLCGALGLIGGVCCKALKTLTKPHGDLKIKVEKIGKTVDEHSEFLKRDMELLEQGREERKILMRGMIQLITHELDGNHIEKLAEVRDDMQEYLIER